MMSETTLLSKKPSLKLLYKSNHLTYLFYEYACRKFQKICLNAVLHLVANN